jgi:hypothetical protein
MAMNQSTKEFLNFLQKNPAIRAHIKAPRDATLLYAGKFFKPMWQEIEDLKLIDPQYRSKITLPDVLRQIRIHTQQYQSLLEWAKAIDLVQPWLENGFITWRALSGIFAANASGTVSFAIGSEVSRLKKVFAATELSVLLRNPNIDANTRNLLAYYDRCIKSGQSSINVGFLGG